MNTTLNKIRENNPCRNGWEELLNHLNKTKADDVPLPFKTILESNGIEDAVWCLRTLPFTDQAEFMAEVAESVLPIFEAKYPQDDRPRKAIEAIRKFQKGQISEETIKAVHDAAYDASDVGADDAGSAAYAAYSAAADADDAADAVAADATAFHAVAAAATAAADAAYTAAYAAATAYAAEAAFHVAVAAAEAARKNKWREIEDLFRKHFC